MTKAYDRMVEIAAEKSSAGYLRSYLDDLYKHDKRNLENPISNRYIWILRTTGTTLFPIGIGHHPIWVTYWINQGNSRDTPSLAYLVSVATGEVKPITYDQVKQLTNLALAEQEFA